MAKNIFLDRSQFKPKMKRNAYDLSYLNNGTYEEGYLYPVDFTEVTFGDSVRIDIRAALRTMPMVWPIQTPVLVKFYVFYHRYRNLWKNFMDFRFNNKQCVHPFISQPSGSDFWKTGSLSDYLGIPTTYASDEAYKLYPLVNPSFVQGSVPRSFVPFYRKTISALDLPLDYTTLFSYLSDSDYKFPSFMPFVVLDKTNITGKVVFDSELVADGNVRFLLCRTNNNNIHDVIAFQSVAPTVVNNTFTYNLSTGDVQTSYDTSFVDTHSGLFGLLSDLDERHPDVGFSNFTFFLIASNTTATSPINSFSFPTPEQSRHSSFFVGAGVHELNDVSNPFAGSSPVIPLNALPFRAYEATYRSYFQDFVNEPFVVDGVEQYNRYVTNLDDGADTTDYHLFRRNWEADFLTSAKPSPQQGLAPLVGVTSSGDAILVNANGEHVRVSIQTAPDGDTMQSWREYNDQNVDGTVRRRLLDMATTGFSINSFRNTNAYQQWLEANWRRSLKFKDQVLSNFGVDLEYKELDMPEFLGGFTIPLDVNAVTQTSSSVSGQPLGQQGANAGAFGSAKHSISHYCDEEGCIMTLMCITPIPVYSQLLNKHWLKSNPLDYYNPQFGKIGNQPISYEEVCPIQAFNEGRDVTDTFGYQRPWYHLISSTDEVHGQFRTDMRGFLYNRTFANAPELGADFLHIDPSQMNEIFIDTIDGAAHFYGQIAFKKYKKTCIPRYNVPSLN